MPPRMLYKKIVYLLVHLASRSNILNLTNAKDAGSYTNCIRMFGVSLIKDSQH